MRKAAKSKRFLVNALLGIGNDDAEVLANLHDMIFQVGDFIRQKDYTLYEEMIRFFTSIDNDKKQELLIKRTLENQRIIQN